MRQAIVGTLTEGTHYTSGGRLIGGTLRVEFSSDVPIVVRADRKVRGLWVTHQEQDGTGGEFVFAASSRDWRLAVVVPEGVATVAASIAGGR
jgi:hypothetical protein